MFRPTINTTPLVSPTANNFFRNISGENFNGDFSFISTLRALVAKRMKNDETINVCFRSTSYSKNTIEEVNDRDVIEAMYRAREYSDGTITIHSFNGTAPDNLAAFRAIEKSFTSVNTGFERIVKVTEFFRKTFYSVCYVDPRSHKVVIFVDKLNIRRMHYLQCAIFAFLPWYFNPSDGVAEDEMELIQSLRETTPDRYMAAITKIAAGYNLREMFIRQQLKGFETAYEEQQCRTIQENISDYIDQIRGYNNSISTVLNRKRDAEIRLLGLQTKIAQMEGEDSEIMEYFLCNSKLDLEGVEGSELTFVVRDYLMYFDEDMAKTIIDNDRSYVYRYTSEYITKDDMKKLMYAIFIDQVLKIRFCCAYRVILGERVKGIERYPYDESCNTYTPNPHIDRYSCLGNYSRTMNECLMANDTIGAIEQCIASCKSLNFSDSTVMEEFMKRLCGVGGYRHNKCIELPDGKIVDAKGAVAWIKEQEAVSHQENEECGQDDVETEASDDTEDLIEEDTDFLDEEF